MRHQPSTLSGFLSVFVALSAFAAGPATPKAENKAEAKPVVLVPGDPPLTEELIGRHRELSEWLLAAPLTESQRVEQRELLIQAWKSKSKPDIDGALEIVAMHKDLGEQEPKQRNAMQESLRDDYVKGLQRAATKSNHATWILSVNDSIRSPLTKGKAQLTRQMTDAYAELLVFMAGTTAATPPAKETRESVAKTLAASYRTLKPAQQKQLTQAPQVWAAVRATWPSLPEAERAKRRAEWTKLLPKPPEAAKDSGKGGSTEWLGTMSPKDHASAVELLNAVDKNWSYALQYW
jgi:hypothetical protein